MPRLPRNPFLLRRERGVTLIELMVALTIGSLVALAAVAALIMARRGFNAVDNTTQMRENGRFASSVIQRIVGQAGFEDAANGWFTYTATSQKNPGLQGFDNALIPSANLANPVATGVLAHGTRSTCSVSDTSCANGSDILVVRFWGSNRPGTTTADGSVVNCAGIAEPLNTASAAWSIFHVVRSASTEPTLACTYIDPATSTWKTEALAVGVEGFQVLYGTEGVTPNTATSAPAFVADGGVPDRYLRASQLDVAGNAAATANNWRRVRSLRIALLMRGSTSSAVDKAGTARTISVLGDGFVDTSNDVGSALTVAADGRLRDRQIYNIHLRNAQYAP